MTINYHNKQSDFCINEVTCFILRTSQQVFEKYFSLTSKYTSLFIKCA